MRFKVAAAAVAVVVVVVGLVIVVAVRQFAPKPGGIGAVATTPSPASTPSLAPTATPTPPDMAAEMERLIAHLPPKSVSVAARNLATGAGFTYGSTGDQTTASVFKVNIVEALMLKHQETGTPLTQNETHDATVMIEASDNDSATYLYQDVGGAEGIRAANRLLGLRCTHPDPHSWGLTVTCAEDQVQLLYQLENASSPLTQSSRDFILHLMQNVIPSQRWGVPVVADPDTTFAVKNGWLDLEEGRDWVIDSMAIVTYKGQPLLIATLSQHLHSMESGVSLNEQLAKLAAESVPAP